MSEKKITPRTIIQTQKSYDQREYLIEGFIETQEKKLDEPIVLIMIQAEKEREESMKKKPN